jgi:two-component system cell cycle response regulator DivK
MKGHVLVVEDNPANRELLCDWLESEGYRVSVATTLAEAKASFVDPLPEIVLLDVQLGAEDGLCLLSWMRNERRHERIPVIAVTAHAISAEQTRIQQAGCDACVPKPIDFKVLAAQLNVWMARPTTK